MSLLSRVLAPLSIDSFYESFDNRCYFHQRGDPFRFRDVLRIEDLDRFFQSCQLPAAFLKVVRDGKTHPPEEWTRESGGSTPGVLVAEVERLFALFRNGATLVISKADEAIHPVDVACSALSRELGFPVGANIYLTPPAGQGFQLHSDEHDVLILQLSGSKNWVVHPDGAAPMQLQLAPGDVLFIPRMMPHEARCSDDSSVHVTIGLYPVSFVHLLEEMAHAAQLDPECRAPIRNPAILPEEQDALNERFRGLVEQILSRRPAAHLFQDNLQRRSAKQPNCRANQLSTALKLPALGALSILRLRPGVSVTTRQETDGLVLCFAGRFLRFPHFLAGSLDSIAKGAAFRVADLPGLLTDNGKVEFVRELAAAGILEILQL
jgi:hypothetical protein